MFKLNGTQLKITQGDTGELEVVPTGASFGENDRVLLTITDREKQKILHKIAAFANGVATFTFANADTANVPEGEYLWELRFVKSATITDGEITAGNEIMTPNEAMPLRILDALGDIGATEGE